MARRQRNYGFDMDSVDDTELDIYSKADVCYAIRPVAASWSSLFLMLRVHPDELDTIKVTHYMSLYNAQNEAASLWLKGAYDIKRFGPPSWRSLVEAVACEAGGNNPALAKSIALNHPVQAQSAGKPTQETAKSPPTQGTAPPTQETAPLTQGTALSTQETAPPTLETALPTQDTALPTQETTPPTLETALPTQDTALPTQETAPQETATATAEQLVRQAPTLDAAAAEPQTTSPSQAATPPPSAPPFPTQEMSGASELSHGPNQYPWFQENARHVVNDMDSGIPPHDYFEPYPRKHLEPLLLSFGSVKPEAARGKPQQRQHSSYAMQCWPHGIAIIINNVKFVSQNERKGSEIDERNTIQTFRYLGYRVRVYRNLTTDQMRDVFEWVRDQDHTPFDSFVCCIFSHGTDKGLRGSDSELLDVNKLASQVNGRCCPGLSKKPKMFFIQSCRGRETDRGAVVADGDNEPADRGGDASVVQDGGDKVPSESDFFFGYATPQGSTAWRDEMNGSWYITELCRSLCEQGASTDLVHLMQHVHKVIGREYETQGKKMAPECVTRLTKDVFFFS